MRLVTFNMRQGGSHARWKRILDETQPDLLFVQETSQPQTLLADLIDPLPLGALYWAKTEKNAWGSAIRASSGTVKPIPVPGYEGWVSGGEVTSQAGDVFAFSVHLPRRPSYLVAAHAVLDALSDISCGAPLILAGDWNFTVCERSDDEPLENKKGELGFLARLRDEFGLQPAWRLANPTGALPQTLRWSRDPVPPFHCDGVFLDPDQVGPVTRAEVLSDGTWTKMSDHNPLVVEVGG